jgi:hypothetical protein
MEIHKPKAVHNWRELLTELGTITLGICIALAGEQTLEWLHWRNQVQEAKAVIATETAYNIQNAILRMRTINCGERRLDELANILDQAARSGSLPPVGDIGTPPRTMWHSAAWESVVASQTATHFPRQQLADLGGLYKIVERADQYFIFEMEAWSDLYAMVGPGRRLDPASEAQLRQAFTRARNDGRVVAAMSMFLIAQTRTMNLRFSRNELDEIAEVRNQALTGGKPTAADPQRPYPICGPIGPVPGNYGGAPINDVPRMVSDSVKSMPAFGAPDP